MPPTRQITIRPVVQLVGDIDHPDYRDAVAHLSAEAQFVNVSDLPPELIVVAQGRPGSFDSKKVGELQRMYPLAGMITLAGSWCEGETRTGKPVPGVERLYWYEFPSWWRRQIALRAAGLCPDWARPDDFRFRSSGDGLRNALRQSRGLVAICAGYRETADAISDVLRRAGYATAWQTTARSALSIRGVVAGVWVGGQLNEREASNLSTFCRQLASDAASVVALLDFPRRDRVDLALEIGAATVLGKPWRNVDLITTLHAIVDQSKLSRAA